MLNVFPRQYVVYDSLITNDQTTMSKAFHAFYTTFVGASIEGTPNNPKDNIT
jgi:hypothetical protein